MYKNIATTQQGTVSKIRNLTSLKVIHSLEYFKVSPMWIKISAELSNLPF